MNRRQSTGMALLMALALMLVLTVMLCSCATKKTVTETVYVHDTLRTHTTDTVKSERVVHTTDTLKIETQKVVTLIEREPGRIDTLRIDNSSDVYRSTAVVDSTARLRVAVDSLLKALDRQHDKTTVKKTSPPWKFIAVCLGLLIASIVVLSINNKRTIP